MRGRGSIQISVRGMKGVTEKLDYIIGILEADMLTEEEQKVIDEYRKKKVEEKCAKAEI